MVLKEIQNLGQYHSPAKKFKTSPGKNCEHGSNIILVSGLAPNVQNADLYRHFSSEFGPVLNALVRPEGTRGVVTFVYAHSACQAVKAARTRIFGREAKIHVVKKIDVPSRSKRDQTPPSWLLKFKDWLPKLLEAEKWSPFSLEDDFQAKFGSRLDYGSLGYETLDDFIRSEVPEVLNVARANPTSISGLVETFSGKEILPGSYFRQHDMHVVPSAEANRGPNPGLVSPENLCVNCCKDPSTWFAFSCEHSSLCSSCISALQKHESWLSECSVCLEPAGLWLVSDDYKYSF